MEFALDPSLIFGLLASAGLLILSAMIAAAEVAFFSLDVPKIESLKESGGSIDLKIVELLKYPKKLIATIVIAHSMVNIGVVIISEPIAEKYITFANEGLNTFIHVVVVTFLIVLIGEVIPKLYTNQNVLATAKKLAYPLDLTQKLFSPISYILVKSTSAIDRRIKSKAHEISVDDLSQALELTSNDHTPEEERKILKGIVEFGNTEVKQIMKPRMDVTAFPDTLTFSKLIERIIESGFSRVPVYHESFDNVKGVLYIKDLLAHLHKDDSFDWLPMIRKPYFVPENKKIDDLMKEFQTKKNHLAIVVDEFGGTNGIVTLEDIIEEVMGDINDEFDDDELTYSKLDDNNYIFEGKILLNDMSRVLNVDNDIFDSQKGESDSLAGFILEKAGRIPDKHYKMEFDNFIFEVEAVDKRRIKRVKVTVKEIGKNPENANVGIFTKMILCLFGFGMLFSSCDEEVYSPKPRGYMRVDFPKKEYVAFNDNDCPFTFYVPTYAKVNAYTGTGASPCWKNIDYNPFNARLHVSFFPLKNDLNSYTEESRELTYKHTIKADAISEQTISNKDKKVYGLVYIVDGNAASSMQFFVTDSSRYFLRGALYFNAVPNSDSLMPIANFIKEDVLKMIESFEWKK